MEMGYVENGFIVDLSNSRRTADMIYELSRILDIPEAKGRGVCIKFGSSVLEKSQLLSVQALVESMDLTIEFITTESEETKQAAEELGIKVSSLENEIPVPEFTETAAKEEEQVNPELEKALDKIFGDSDFSEDAVKEIAEVQEQTDDETMKELEKELQEYIEKSKETEKLPTLYIQRNLRSGQSIKSDGNLVIIGDVNPGSEIIAKGDITVWGILGGIAHAGCDGNLYTKIRALKMNAIQLRIGDVFARRPDSVNIPFVQKTDTFTPEEARVFRKQILIHKIHEA